MPGHNPANGDRLHVGCWAAHEDGSLLFVKGHESGSVVYDLFDMAHDPPLVLPDAMPEIAFKKAYSWPGGASGEVWTWHDKRPFEWSKVMGMFRPGGIHRPSVDDDLSASARAAERLGRRRSEWRQLGRDEVEPYAERQRPTIRRMVQEELQRAIRRQPTGPDRDDDGGDGDDDTGR